jgi:hypothetical protein
MDKCGHGIEELDRDKAGLYCTKCGLRFVPADVLRQAREAVVELLEVDIGETGDWGKGPHRERATTVIAAIDAVLPPEK